MRQAFFIRLGSALLCLLLLGVPAWSSPQRVRTTTAPILAPAHTSDLGYLEVTGRSVWVPVQNISRQLHVGQLKPMLQRNQDFYIGLFLYDDGYAEMFAVPRILSDGSGSAWVTQEHELMFGRRTETRAGRFFFSPTEFLPIVDETETEFVVTCKRFGRTFPLRVSKQMEGIRRTNQVPAHVAAAMEQRDGAVLLAASQRRGDRDTGTTSSRANVHVLDDQRPDDPDFVDPYPEPVLAVRRPTSPVDQDDPFLPLETTHAGQAQVQMPAVPAVEPLAAADMEPVEDSVPRPPRVVRRHVIDNLSQDLRVEFQTGKALQPTDRTDTVAQADQSEPGGTVVSFSSPSVEFLPAATEQKAEISRTEAAPPPARQVAASKPTVEETTPVEKVRPPAPFDDLAKPEDLDETPLQIATAAQTPEPPHAHTAEPATTTVADPAENEAVEHGPTEEILLAQAPETDAIEEPVETQTGQAVGGISPDATTAPSPAEIAVAKVAEAETAEAGSTLMTVAVNLLIFFALLTVAFVVIVIALALFLNRRKLKKEEVAVTPERPKAVQKGTAPVTPPADAPAQEAGISPPEIPAASSFSESIDEEFAHAAEEESGTFTGSLESFSVAELIQFLNSSRETGLLYIDPSDDDVSCKLYFERGEIIDALSSSHTGERAVADILSMRDGLFSFTRQQEVETHRTVRQSTMSMLLQVQPFDPSPPLSVP